LVKVEELPELLILLELVHVLIVNRRFLMLLQQLDAPLSTVPVGLQVLGWYLGADPDPEQVSSLNDEHPTGI
jgi:hypothetical protein